MAKGITQDQVNQAADQLLLAGERPTIDRIRASLGTGSPNTVNRLLDTWWVALGERLTKSQSTVSLPDAPADIAVMAGQLWERALSVAQTEADRQLETDRQDLTAERAALSVEREQLKVQVQQMAGERDSVASERDALLSRMTDLQRLLELQTMQLGDLAKQRDSSLLDSVAANDRVAKLQSEALQRQAAWDQERVALDATHTAMQNRWLSEVDRARQDEAKSAAKVKHLEQLAESSSKKIGEQMAELSKRLQQSEQEGTKKTARIAALEGEIFRVHEQLKNRLHAESSPSAKPAIKKAKKNS